MPKTVNLYNGVDWDCPECGCENEIMYDSCSECDLEVEINRPHDKIKELQKELEDTKTRSEKRMFTIEVLEKRVGELETKCETCGINPYKEEKCPKCKDAGTYSTRETGGYIGHICDCGAYKPPQLTPPPKEG